MGTLFKIFIILFAIYYFFRLFGGWILRGLLVLLGRQMVRNFQKAQEQQQQAQKRQEEGEVTIIRDEKQKGRKAADDEGDYVDFEEVKD